MAGEESPRRGGHRPPPVLRPLLRAAARQHLQLDRLGLPGRDAPVDADQGDLGARGAEVDGEDVPFGRRESAHGRSIAPAVFDMLSLNRTERQRGG